MSWEKFEYTKESYFPKVTIRTNGQIGFSHGAVKKFNVDSCAGCVLHYDRTGDKIGMKLVTEDEMTGAFPIKRREFDRAVPAKSFLDFYGIGYETSRSFKAQHDVAAGLIVVDLRNPLRSKAHEQ